MTPHDCWLSFFLLFLRLFKWFDKDVSSKLGLYGRYFIYQVKGRANLLVVRLESWDKLISIWVNRWLYTSPKESPLFKYKHIALSC